MKVLMTTLSAGGDAFPYVEVAKRLTELGHEVIVASSPEVRYLFVGEGIPFVAIGRFHGRGDRETLSAIFEPDEDGLRSFVQFLERMIAPDLQPVTEALTEQARQADVVVAHPLQFGGHIAARAAGTPLVLYSPAPPFVSAD